MWVATAVLGAGVLGAGASIYSSNKQADAANKAAQVQADASNQSGQLQYQAATNAAALQKSMFDQNVARTQPYVDFGTGQFPTLNKLLTPGPDQTDTLSKLPGFQFSQDWGQKAIKNQGTMNGLSGNTLRAGADYATGSAQQYFGNYVNQLMSAAGIGGNAAGNLGNQGTQAGNAIAGSTMAGGQALGQGAMGAGNALAGGLVSSASSQAGGLMGATNSLTSGANGFSNNYLQQQYINKLTNGGMYGETSVGGAPLSPGGLFR